ncbi:hypothetical protein PINS_up013012 [Pythium insidiosum]|nr:hypothetical protein PINS_up013012 [Pythium insidiosum]
MAMRRFLAPTIDGESEWSPSRRSVQDDSGDDDAIIMDELVEDDEAFEDSEDDDSDERRASGRKRSPSPDAEMLSDRAARRLRRNHRREIAAVPDDDDLDDSTRQAREAERARASHAAALLDDAPDGHVARVCLNPRSLAVDGDREERDRDRDGDGADDGEQEEPVYVHKDISANLKPHQIKGARFLWSHVAVEPHGFGCILADFMGLGKTLQVITVVQAFLTLKRQGRQRFKHVLILAPTICVRNWEAEMVKWLGKKDARRLGVLTLESSREKKLLDRVQVVKHWHRRGGVLIMGYELYRILALQSSGDEKLAASQAKHAQAVKQVYPWLCDPGPDLIVLDEGHRVRDHKSKLVKALSHVKTARRILLTGYPLQNHLEEYWTMVNFTRPNYLGSLEDFKNRFVNPIENGQCVDSTEADKRLARQRAYVLTNELKTLVLRRDQEYLFKQLPPKREWVLLCRLTEAQAQLYRQFLEAGVPRRGELAAGVGGRIDVLGGYHISLAISNHPDVLHETFRQLEDAIKSGNLQPKRKGPNAGDDNEDDLMSFLVTSTINSAPTPLSAPGRGVLGGGQQDTVDLMDDDEDDETSLLDALNAPRGGASLSAPSNTSAGTDAKAGFDHRLGFARDFMRQYIAGQMDASGKMMILLQILHECKAIGDRVILFSQSIPTLNTVEKMIAMSNRRQTRVTKRLNHLRIDGSTPQQERFRMIGQFNDWEEDVDLIMISTKAGGEGVNLCAGNRIIIFDVCWNPCNDSQSMCRSYRFGQVKPVFVYRFVSAGTMEKKVYDLQIRKEGVAKRIVDEKALERKFKSADLQNYFNKDDFEESMRQQSSVLTGIGFSSSSNGDSSAGDGESTAEVELRERRMPTDDIVLQSVFTRMKEEGATWVLDWFEQETMFEEALDDNCTEDEQAEITASYNYVKALRNLRLRDGPLPNREGVLVVMCGHCRIPNDVFPESLTKVPVPKFIECQYCQRPTETSAASPSANVATGVGVPGYMTPGLPYAVPIPGAMPRVPIPSPTPINGGATCPTFIPNLPPHLQALIRQQQAQALIRQQQAQAQPSVAPPQRPTPAEQIRQFQEQLEKRRQQRQNLKLADRHLLILRRGMSKCQELKRQAEACGARLAIEVNPQLTDIVSAMSQAETLRWLKLTKFPRDVDFRDDIWLRNEIAKATNSTSTSSATGSTGVSSMRTEPNSSGAISIDLSSDSETETTITAKDHDSDDDDIVEIL